jgi:AraC-like DNA-binding protein
MVQFETFSTLGLEPRRKLESWNDFASESFTPLVSDPVDVRTFNGHLVRACVEDLQLAEVYSDPQLVRHSQVHTSRSRDAMFFLHLQLEGECVTRQDGRQAVLRPGDFSLCDTTRPYDLIFDKSNRMFVLGIPGAVLHRHLGSPESVVSICMQGNKGMSGLVSGLLRSFWSDFRVQPDAMQAQRVLNVALDLMAGAYSTVPQATVVRSSLAAAHRARILSYIEAHLADPDLTPTAIARACRITTRYLHHLFSDEPETVARYILRRRLEECSKALNTTAQRGRTVTAIAFDHGFNSPTHFGRAFRARFGVTPREYRRCPEAEARSLG